MKNTSLRRVDSFHNCTIYTIYTDIFQQFKYLTVTFTIHLYTLLALFYV